MNLVRRLLGSILMGLAPCATGFADPPSIAVLDFELNDLTLDPGNAEERARTASIRPLLEQRLTKQEGLEIVTVATEDQLEANLGLGYLFDHHDLAADLGRQHGADWIVVGRVHKPSFLFAYLQARVIDTASGDLVGDLVVEVKGPQKRLTARGVESLADKIVQSVRHSPSGRSAPGRSSEMTIDAAEQLAPD